MSEHDARTQELRRNLAGLRERISRACHAAGRAPDEVTLVAVTKTYPADDVVRLTGLGVGDVGENRDQEAAPKAAAVQRNKCRSVAGYADVVHSVDSVRLALALADAASRVRSGPPLDVLIQVSVDGDTARGGARTEAIERIAETIAKASATLVLKGVMAVAPLDWEPAAAFAELQETAAQLRAAYPAATWISAGMSEDLESAIRHGSTHVRVGTALLGNRPALG